MMHQPNADVMLHGLPSATLGQHYFNQNDLGSNHEYICENIFSEHFSSTQLFDLATSNIIFDLFISTTFQKPFPTHARHPSFPKTEHKLRRNKLNRLLACGRSQSIATESNLTCHDNLTALSRGPLTDLLCQLALCIHCSLHSHSTCSQ